MRKLPTSVALLAAALLTAPALNAQEAAQDAPAEADAPADAARAPAEKKAKKAEKKKANAAPSAAAIGNPALAASAGDRAIPLWLTTSLTSSVGTGTFVLSGYGNRYLGSNLALSPMLRLGDFNITANQSFDLEWTQSDSTTTANQVMWSDTLLRVGYMGLSIPAANLAFSFAGGATLPISLASQWSGRLTGLSAGSRMFWSLPSAGLSGSVGANVNYNVILPALANRRLNASDVFAGQAPVDCFLRSDDELGNYACSGGFRQTAFGYGANGGVNWSTLNNQLTLSASMGFMHSIPALLGVDDEKTSEFAQTGVQLGRIPLTSGSVSATYMPTSWFAMTLGTWTMQPLTTSGLMGLRPFPFWDFATSGGPITTPNNNYSTLFLTTSFTI